MDEKDEELERLRKALYEKQDELSYTGMTGEIHRDKTRYNFPSLFSVDCYA